MLRLHSRALCAESSKKTRQQDAFDFRSAILTTSVCSLAASVLETHLPFLQRPVAEAGVPDLQANISYVRS